MSHYETILNSLQEAVLLFNKRGRLLYLNKAGEELFGRSLWDLKDRGLGALFAKSCDISGLVKKTIHEGRSYKGRDIELRGLSNASVDVYICPIYDEAIDSAHSRGTVVSTREPSGALLCLKENAYIVDAEDYNFDSLLYLLGSIAHEIKNPLSGIKGAAQLLLARSPDLQGDECLRMILRETDRLNGVLHSYLTMTRSPVFNRLNIHEVLEHSLKVLSPLIKSREINIIRFYDLSLPHISGDESKLLQVFINLLKNAVEACGNKQAKGEIQVSTRLSNEYMLIYDKDEGKQQTGKKQRWVIIGISDNGMGIDAEGQRMIFMPFYTKKKGGTGLGLSLSKKIIKDHGGVIKVKSQIDKGAIFSVYLPLKMEAPHAR